MIVLLRAPSFDLEETVIFGSNEPQAYLIFFTPRSGSTWLTDVCAQTGRLGRPGELFNPAFTRLGERPLSENPAAAVRRAIDRNTHGGVFGAELTMSHVRHVFGSPAILFGFFTTAATVTLIREDTLLQSMSALRKKQTRVGHSMAPAAGKDELFVYDAAFLKKNIAARTRSEQAMDRMLHENGRDPLRLSYERNIANPRGMVDALTQMLAIAPVPNVPDSQLAVMRTSKSEEFAARFRREEHRFMTRIDAMRRPLLQRLADY